MTTLDSRSGWTRLGSARLAALVGGITLAASMTFGTAVGPASAETAAEFLASRCANYIANPQPYEAARSHCDGADLSGVDLSGVDLSWAFLTEANLANATLTGANMDSAYLGQANLTGANLTDLNLTGSALVPADITVDVMDAGWSYDGAYVTWATPSMPTGVEFGACDYPSGTKFPTELTVVKCDVATSSSGSYGYFTVYVIPGPNWGEPPVTGSLGSLNSFFGS
ncbi:pentapeptide repeat-containing protein [Rhodococcus globerulus]|uniref:pentapeptide repeat-containing protein n=1 Tax=Rhodococcus globerulus TaxID=33008 RepID=UPI001F221992|nr:pentapeptide repeat-containing protein [Rhodococcus globerulus]MCE4264587.1 pentapeptide repeat-containing protein [Rhodococcus globerulus]